MNLFHFVGYFHLPLTSNYAVSRSQCPDGGDSQRRSAAVVAFSWSHIVFVPQALQGLGWG